jgi:FkbM family methyltransferase
MAKRNPLLLLEEARQKARTRQSVGALRKSIYSWGWRLVVRPLYASVLRFLAFKQGLTLPARWTRSHHLIHMVMGAFEQETVSIGKNVVQPGFTVIDIGAHIGYFTRLFSELVGPSGRVIAFEPDPTNFNLLARNTARRRNVTVLNKAVADTDGRIKFYIHAHSGSHSLVGENEDSVVDEIAVEAVTLDTFWEQHGCFPVHLVKIDVEGAEPLVLRGAERLIHENPELKLVVEFCPANLHRAGVAPEAFLEQLGGYGFRPLAIRGDGELIDVGRIDMKDREYVNLLCERGNL